MFYLEIFVETTTFGAKKRQIRAAGLYGNESAGRACAKEPREGLTNG